VVGVENVVDVGGGLAESDAGDGGSLSLLLGGAVGADGPFHSVDELLFL